MKIYLRAFELDDYKLVNEWRQNDENQKLTSGNKYFVSSEREKNWILEKIANDKNDIYLAICLKDNNEMIGFLSINNIDLRNCKAEWGGTFIGNNKYWGKGYARESAKLMLEHLFNEYPLHKCYGYCLEEHSVTKKLFASLGFTRDGVLRDEIFKGGEFKTLLIYSVLRDEFFPIEK